MSGIDIYTERAVLLSLLSRHYTAHVVPVTDPEPGFEWAVCLHINGKQHAWHIADHDLHLFKRLLRTDGHYDGHTTQEKYESLMKAAGL